MIAALPCEWTSEPLLVRSIGGKLPVCSLREAIPLIKYSVTFKNDPYHVLLQLTNSGLNLNV